MDWEGMKKGSTTHVRTHRKRPSAGMKLRRKPSPRRRHTSAAASAPSPRPSGRRALARRAAEFAFTLRIGFGEGCCSFAASGATTRGRQAAAPQDEAEENDATEEERNTAWAHLSAQYQ